MRNLIVFSVFALAATAVLSELVQTEGGTFFKGDTPDVRNRIFFSALGALTADYATKGLHGVWDTNLLKHLVEQEGEWPEFHKKPENKMYGYSENYEPTHFGREYLAVLSSIDKNGVDGQQNLDDLIEFIKLEKEAGRYVDPCNVETLKNVEEGKKFPYAGSYSRAANCLAKVPAVVALYSGSERLADACEDVMSINQQGHIPHVFGIVAAQILDGIIHGRSIANATHHVCAAHKEAFVRESYERVTKKLVGAARNDFKLLNESAPEYGASANFPKIWPLTLHVLLGFDSYMEAIRANIMVGGDQAGRAIFLGACFAALNSGGIPQHWIHFTPLWTDTSNVVISILNNRTKEHTSNLMKRHHELEEDYAKLHSEL